MVNEYQLLFAAVFSTHKTCWFFFFYLKRLKYLFRNASLTWHERNQYHGNNMSLCCCQWLPINLFVLGEKNGSFHKAAFHLPRQEFHVVDSRGFVSQLSVSEGPRVTTPITTLLWAVSLPSNLQVKSQQTQPRRLLQCRWHPHKVEGMKKEDTSAPPCADGRYGSWWQL